MASFKLLVFVRMKPLFSVPLLEFIYSNQQLIPNRELSQVGIKQSGVGEPESATFGGLNRRLALQLHRSVGTRIVGLAYHGLDDALGLTPSAVRWRGRVTQ